jgi:hypothetical protein
MDRFLATLSESGGKDVKVLAQRDIAALIGLERQKQMMGCADAASTSCLAELAGALGADGLVAVSITKSDPYYVATARLVHAHDASTWATASERVGREGDLFDVMDSIARRFATSAVATAPGTTGVSASQSGGRRFIALVPAVLGFAAAGAGLGVFLSAGSERAALEPGTLNQTDARAAVSSGRMKEQLGIGLLVGGAVVLAAGVLWFLLGGGS